jgi:hypothetical protein
LHLRIKGRICPVFGEVLLAKKIDKFADNAGKRLWALPAWRMAGQLADQV